MLQVERAESRGKCSVAAFCRGAERSSAAACEEDSIREETTARCRSTGLQMAGDEVMSVRLFFVLIIRLCMP